MGYYNKKSVFAWILILAVLLSGCGNRSGEGGYIVIDKALHTQSYGIGFRNGDDELCDTLAASLKILAANGTAQDLAGQYLDGRELEIEADSTALDDMEIEFRTLIVGIPANKPPLAYTNPNGDFIGFDVEMAEAACRLLGWAIEFRAIEFEEQVELDSGNVDCLWGGFTLTASLKKSLTCSEPYLSYDQILVTRNGAGYKSFNSLKGKVIGVPSDNAAAAVLSLDESVLPKNAETREYEDYDACFDALNANDVQGILISSISAAWYAR